MLLSTPGVYTLNVKSAGVLSGEATRPGLTLEKPVKQKQKSNNSNGGGGDMGFINSSSYMTSILQILAGKTVLTTDCYY